MQVKIDPTKCIGCEKCNTLAAAVFKYDADDEISHVIMPQVSDPTLEAKVHKAASACPTGAISMIDDAGNSIAVVRTGSV